MCVGAQPAVVVVGQLLGPEFGQTELGDGRDPAIGIAWLANKLAPWGESLKAGQIVLAGSFTRPVAAKAGDLFEADYGPLGQMTFKFV